MRRQTGRGARTGCGLLLVTCGVTVLLLLLNRLFVSSLYDVIVLPAHDSPRVRIVVLFLSVLLLLLPEWWLIDRVTQQFRRLYQMAEQLRDRH